MGSLFFVWNRMAEELALSSYLGLTGVDNKLMQLRLA